MVPDLGNALLYMFYLATFCFVFLAVTVVGALVSIILPISVFMLVAVAVVVATVTTIAMRVAAG